MNRFWSNNNVLRVIALVLSCILWFAVQPSPDSGAATDNVNVSEFPMAVHVQTSDDMVVTKVQPSTAIVAVHDSTLSVESLAEQMLGVQLVANVRGLKPGQHQVPLTAQHMPLVQYSISPSTVTVVIADRKTTQQSVRVIVRGQPAAGYSVGTPQCDVATVKASGAQQALDKVATVAAFVSVQGATDTVSQEVTLAAVDGRGNPVDGVIVEPSTAHVNVPILAPHKNVPVSASASGSPAAGYDVVSLTPSVSSVTLYGTHLPKHLTVPVDVSGFNHSRTVSVKVPLPAGVKQATPSMIQVHVQVEPYIRQP
ncbi:YbbR-like domain-containing protein [Alicyclobacillus herbarius]|uniref:CdaR family protein n=1 Tax=Alicyclobacillus herbarius TaxID=122960 RepID=UPI002352A09B|nr:CdaR family protein [Alicyclobacillus herbarius]